MPVIKPISALRNKSREIAELARNSEQPIFITTNGEGDLVVMSLAHYTKLQMTLDLLSKLGESEQDWARGERGRPLRQVMKDVRKRLREQAKI
jgi:prevent-host-death family protein